MATGMFSRSLNRISASVASSRATPGPASTTGWVASASTSAARCTWRSSGAGSTGMFTFSGSPSTARSATSSGSDEERRARPLGRGLLEGLADHLRRGRAHRDHVAPLRDRPEQRHEVDELVRLLVDPVEPRLRGDRDERMGVELRVRDAEHQVDRARTEGREAHARLAGERPVRVGHERGAALVARRDEPDRASRRARRSCGGSPRRGGRRRTRRPRARGTRRSGTRRSSERARPAITAQARRPDA